MASRKPLKQGMLLFSPLVAHAFFGLGLWLFECDYIPWRLLNALDSGCPSELGNFIPTVQIKQLRLGSQLDWSQLLQRSFLHALLRKGD